MEWQSKAIVLGARKHGEGHAVLEVLSEGKGRATGYVRGGSSRRQRPDLQPGNLVEVTWRGRLDEHLGTFRVEIERALSPSLFSAPDKLAALNATAGLLMAALPEREQAEEIYRETLIFLEMLSTEAEKLDWGAELAKLELMLLSRLGFGLEIDKCAATGEVENLCYVSPKTGRAVSREAGEPYKEKLLPLPAFLTGKTKPDEGQILAGLTLTGHFIETHLLHGDAKGLEGARSRLLRHFSPK